MHAARVKLFQDHHCGWLESAINDWLEQQEQAYGPQFSVIDIKFWHVEPEGAKHVAVIYVAEPLPF